MTKTKTTRNVATLPRERRLAVAHHFTGKRIQAERRYCGIQETLTGTVVCVAVSHGGGADVLVLQQDGHQLADAYSLAQLVSFTEL